MLKRGRYPNGVWWSILLFTLLVSLRGQVMAAENLQSLTERIKAAIDRGGVFFRSISTEGGYVYHVSLDLTERWGEGRLDAHTIEVQSPGTPAVGQTFLRAYEATGNRKHLEAAFDAGRALIRGQNELGGWGHTIRFNSSKARRVSFDDNQTQGAIRFLMALDQRMDDESLTAAIDKALTLMVRSQLDNGGWPHMYPPNGDYHDYATFNDNGINDCIAVMMDAVKFYPNPEYKACQDGVGRFLLISQLPPPQPGWAQQYNEFLQPAWARDFEPPAVCPLVTLRNLTTLMDLYDATGRSQYLKPIPDAIRWLVASRMPNGLWARFVEIGTGKALYYDRDRIRVDTPDQLHIERRTGYGYENDLSHGLQQAKTRFTAIRSRDAKPSAEDKASVLRSMIPRVRAIIEAQDAQGRWVTQRDRFKKHVPGVRWNGEYTIMDRISSSVFNANMRFLSDFLSLCEGHADSSD